MILRHEVLAAAEYYDEYDIAKGYVSKSKTQDPYVMSRMCNMMQKLLPEDAHNIVLVPVPAHFGYATVNKYLCMGVAARYDTMRSPMIADVLKGRQMGYPWKYRKTQGETEHPPYHIENPNRLDIGPNKRIIFVDDVVATGATFQACKDAFNGRGEILTFAIDSNTFENSNKR